MTERELFQDYYREEEMAKLLGITVPALRNRISKAKDHPPFVGRGRGRLFPKEEYRKWLKTQMVYAAG